MDASQIHGRAYDYSRDEWSKRKSTIVELYPKMTLPQMREELARRGFCPTTKQLKTKITEWGLEKSPKKGEMIKVARIRKWRRDEKQKESIIKRNGVVIKDINIDRWEKQHPLSPILRSPSPLVSPFTCDTPGPSGDTSSRVDSASIQEISAVTGLSELLSVCFKQILHGFFEGMSGQKSRTLKKFTPSLLQKRRLWIQSQENRPVFESVASVIPPSLTASQARISDADLISMVKAGDLNGLDQVFQNRQACPLDLLENNRTFIQIAATSRTSNKIELVDYFLNKGADPNFALEDQWNTSQTAVAVLDFTLAAHLLERPFNIADPDTMFDHFMDGLHILFAATDEMSKYMAAMILHTFQFIDQSAFHEAISIAEDKTFHDANQLWAFAIAIRCATACSDNPDIVEKAWQVFEYHLHADVLDAGWIKLWIQRTANLHYNGDCTAELQDARRLFCVALDKVVPEENWLEKFDLFEMAPVEAAWYAWNEYHRLARFSHNLQTHQDTELFNGRKASQNDITSNRETPLH